MRIRDFTIRGHRVFVAYKKRAQLYNQVEAQAAAEHLLRHQGIEANGDRYGCFGVGPLMVVFSA